MTAAHEELLSLIGRLEEATEPSRELDSAIRWWLHDRLVKSGSTREAGRSPAFTSSIDAAIPGEDIHMVTRVERADGSRYWKAYNSTGDEGVGNTEALARRIACLKARAKLMESAP